MKILLFLLVLPAWGQLGSYPLCSTFTNSYTSGYLIASNGDGTCHWIAPGSSGAGGPTGAVQYNSGGSLAGNSGLTYDGSNLAIGNAVSAKNLYVSVTSQGAKCDWNGSTGTDDTAAFQAAVTAASGGGIVIPGPCRVEGPVNILTSLNISGLNRFQSEVAATQNASTPFLVASGVKGVVFSDLLIQGPGKSTSTGYGVETIDANNISFRNVDITGFSKGIWLHHVTPGISNFSDTILASRIYGNAVNIVGESGSNELALFNVAIGGSAGTGVYLVDSGSLTVENGDCSGNTVTCFDIDASTPSPAVAGFVIEGMSFEANSTSSGNIRLGNTNTVYGVTLRNNQFCAGVSDLTPINAVNVTGYERINNTISSCTGSYTTAPEVLGNVAFQAGGAPSWQRYHVSKVANGSSGCSSATGCWLSSGPGVSVQAAAASVSQSIDLTAFPAGSYAQAARLQTTTSCTGATTITLASLGTSSQGYGYFSNGNFSTQYDLTAAVSAANVLDPQFINPGAGSAAAQTLGFVIRTTGGLVSNIANGCAFDISIQWDVLP